jgi:CRISPR-associated protein Cst2
LQEGNPAKALNNNDKPSITKRLSHIAGTFVIDAMPSFLNGAGIAKYTEDKNYTVLKTFADGIGELAAGAEAEGELEGGPRKIRHYRTVFVSAQSFRRMLRDTILEETGWKPSIIRAFKQTDDGHTSKAGTALDPVSFVEDDAFGYMYTSEGSGKPVVTATTSTDGTVAVTVIESEGDENSNGEPTTAADTATNKQPAAAAARVRTVSRTSPLSTSILVGLRKDGWEGRAESFVSLLEGTPLPYSTQFANTPFTGIFSLDYSRLCKFTNVGDRIELSDELVEQYLDTKVIIEVPDKKPEYYSLETKIADVVETKGKNKGKVKKGKISTPIKQFGKVYELANNSAQIRKERASAIINSLAVLRGGAKQAAFETDVSPKILILAGLTCGNPIFNTVFEDDNSANTRGKTVSIDVHALKEIVRDYKDKICTPVYVGIRTGFLKNEDEVNDELTREDGFVVTTPRDAARQLTESLPVGSS